MQGADRQSGAPIIGSEDRVVGLTYGRFSALAGAAACNSCGTSSVRSIRIQELYTRWQQHPSGHNQQVVVR
jgi:hypothetical protein